MGGLQARVSAGRAKPVLLPVHCQRRELDFGLTDEAERHAIFRIDVDDPRHDWRLADGDAQIAPGVTAVLTAGHTPGHQSFVIDFDDSIGGGGYVLAFDAADLTENIEGEVSVGSRVPASPEGVRRAGAPTEGTGGRTWIPIDPRPRPRGVAVPDP